MDLSDRMRLYEETSRSSLTRRLPIIIRVDGRSFSSYMRHCEDKPFNSKFIHVMECVAMELCREVQGAQIAYVQSDEISILVHGYKKFTSQPWFDNQIQKMCSVAAGVASATFTLNSWKIWMPASELAKQSDKQEWVDPAHFDARAFAIPEADVCNYFVWRQQDAMRNSVQMLARSLYSHRQCDGKNIDEMLEMCAAKNSPWDKLSASKQRGRCLTKSHELSPDGSPVRSGWMTDLQIPIFAQERSYVERFLAIEPEISDQ